MFLQTEARVLGKIATSGLAPECAVALLSRYGC